MTSSISFSGIASGIDGTSVADAVYDQLTTQNTVRDNQIDSLESENTSLEKLKTLLLDISDKFDALRTVSGGAQINKASSSDENIIQVAADSSAVTGSYSITVNSLAKAATASFGEGLTSGSDLLLSDSSAAGKLTFTVGQGSSASSFGVDVDATTTAEDFVESFNKNSDGAASASLVNVGTSESPSYKVLISTSSQGAAEGTLSVSSSNSLLLTDKGLGSFTVDQATNAEFTMTGVSGTITRSSNTISDVLTGVTLSLESQGTSVVNIQSQPGVTSDQLQSIVDAFNSLAEFQSTEDEVTVTDTSDGTKNVYGSLAKTTVDNDALSDLRSAFLSATSSDGTLSLASLGVTTNRDGTLSFNEDTFNKALSANPDGVSELMTGLADKVSGVQGIVSNYTGYSQRIDSEISGNETESSNLSDTNSKVEDMAEQRRQSIVKQFSNLEVLMAKLNSESSVISRLLDF